MNEIEDTVGRGVETSDESRPGYRALRRSGGREPPESARVTETADIGQLVPMTLQKAGIHAIHAEHDDLFAVRFRAMACAYTGARK